MPTIVVNVGGVNYTMTDGAAPPGVGPQIVGPALLGISQALADAAYSRGEYFGTFGVGSPDEGIDLIRKDIIGGRILVF